MFSNDGGPLRHLHAGDTQRTGLDDFRRDEQFSGTQLLSSDLVQGGRAKISDMGGSAACSVVHSNGTVVGVFIFEEDE